MAVIHSLQVTRRNSEELLGVRHAAVGLHWGKLLCVRLLGLCCDTSSQISLAANLFRLGRMLIKARWPRSVNRRPQQSPLKSPEKPWTQYLHFFQRLLHHFFLRQYLQQLHQLLHHHLQQPPPRVHHHLQHLLQHLRPCMTKIYQNIQQSRRTLLRCCPSLTICHRPGYVRHIRYWCCAGVGWGNIKGPHSCTALGIPLPRLRRTSG